MSFSGLHTYKHTYSYTPHINKLNTLKSKGSITNVISEA